MNMVAAMPTMQKAIAMVEAQPSQMAPLMHPLASAGEIRASANVQAMVKIAFMILLRNDDLAGSSRLNDGPSVRSPVDGNRCAAAADGNAAADGRSPAFWGAFGGWGGAAQATHLRADPRINPRRARSFLTSEAGKIAIMKTEDSGCGHRMIRFRGVQG